MPETGGDCITFNAHFTQVEFASNATDLTFTNADAIFPEDGFLRLSMSYRLLFITKMLFH